MDAATDSIPPQSARDAGLCRNLHWLAIGRLKPRELSEIYLQAIAQHDPQLHAFLDVRPALVREQGAAAENRRRDGPSVPRGGSPIALKGNRDVRGRPPTAGGASRNWRIGPVA